MTDNLERQIIGSILFSEDRSEVAFGLLNPKHFSDNRCRQMFASMVNLRHEGKEITPLSVGDTEELQDFAMELSSEVVTSEGIETHCNMLLDRNYLQSAVRGAKKLHELCLKSTTKPKDALEIVEKLALMLASRTNKKGLRTLQSISDKVTMTLDEIASGKKIGVHSGFTRLDSNGFIFKNGKMNVIAARPGMGKSALALDIAQNSGVNTAFFSVEMNADELYERLISRECGLSNNELHNSEYIKRESQNILQAIRRINNQKIWIDDDATKTPMEIISQCKRMKASEGLGLVIVDYMQLLQFHGAESKRHEINEISRILTWGAKELQIPIISLAQLNRDCEKRPDKRPQLSDLKESGNIEQDAHQIWFIYRDEVYNEGSEPGRTEILIRKHRSGPTGMVLLTYEKEATHFTDYIKHSDPFYGYGTNE